MKMDKKMDCIHRLKNIICHIKPFIVMFFLISIILVPKNWGQINGMSGQLQHEVTVSIKLLQVYVTDKRGIPIAGLNRDDFILFDNGDRKEITEFEGHELTLPDRPEPTVIKSKSPSNAPIPLLNRKFFMLFDLVFTEEKGFRVAREAALNFVKNGLLETDEVSVFTFSGSRSLNVLKLPTNNHKEIESSIESLNISDLLNRVFPENDDEPTRIVSSQSASTSDFLSGTRENVSETRILAGNFIWAMKALGQAMRYLPGQKTLILYSKGIRPTTIGRSSAGGTYSELSRGYSDMCKELAGAGISVFPINTQDPDTTIGKGEATLRETAAATGGRLLGFAANSPRHMDTINRITGMYYVLGYPIDQSWDGRFHKVHIRVRIPNCEVHAQPGYFDPKPFAKFSKLEKEIHLIDLALSPKPLSQEYVRFDMQALPIGSEPDDNLIFVAQITEEELASIEGTNVELVCLAFNELDELVANLRSHIDLPSNRAPTSQFFIIAALSSHSGNYKCRIVVRNLDSGRAAVAGSSATVPKNQSGGIVVLPPLITNEIHNAVFLDAIAGKGVYLANSSSLAAQKFLCDTEAYAPYLSNKLTPGASIAASIRCMASNEILANIVLTASLMGLDAQDEIPLALEILKEREDGNTKIFCARIGIPKVNAGSYRLSFCARDQRNNQTSRITRIFRIE
jgi:VWFA-related protein